MNGLTWQEFNDSVLAERQYVVSARSAGFLYSGDFAGLLTKRELSGVTEIKWRDLSLYTARFPAHGFGDH